MDELAKIKSIKRSTQSRAYVTGLHSTPAGMEAANLLLKRTQKTSSPALFMLVVFPDIDKLLSLGSFAALKDAWPIMGKRLSKFLPSSSLCSQTQFGLLIQVWGARAVYRLERTGLKNLIRELNAPFNLSNSSTVRTFSLRSFAGYILLPDNHESPSNAESLISKLAVAAESASNSEERLKRFNPSLQKLLARNEYAINNLPSAIRKEHLELVFQPRVSFKNGGLCGAQTKVIWRDPHHGNIAGSAFKNACALTGMLPDVVKFSIRRSVSFLKNIESNGNLPKNFRLAISIPFEVFQYRNFDLYIELQKSLADSTIGPDNCCIEFEGNLELTSTAYPRALSCIKKISSLCLPVCLNCENNLRVLNFLSTGLISYLKYSLITTDSLKLEDSAKLLGSIVSIARYNNVAVIAAGISSNHQLELFKSKNIDILQGTLFSEDMSESGFQSYLTYSAMLKRKKATQTLTAGDGAIK